jgi:hypothetical protein
MTKMKKITVFYDSPKVAFPERLYGIKIQEIENLSLGHL